MLMVSTTIHGQRDMNHSRSPQAISVARQSQYVDPRMAQKNLRSKNSINSIFLENSSNLPVRAMAKVFTIGT